MTCEDQALVPTDHCLRWGCEHAKLVKQGRFWVCPNCRSSYGENPRGVKMNPTAAKLDGLLRESAHLYQESDDPRSGIEFTRDYLLAHGTIVLPHDHPVVSAEPTEQIVRLAQEAYDSVVIQFLDAGGPDTQVAMRAALRVALGLLREGL